MKEYSITYNIERIVKTNGKKGKKRVGEVIIKANSELAAKHKFYQKHSFLKGYCIESIDEMLKEKK